MEAPVEIRYAGVLVGRAQEVRAIENEVAEFFLFMRDPLPVGTAVQLRSGERETPARVVKALEAQDPAQSGMQIRFEGAAAESASRWIPAPPSANDPPIRPLPAPSKSFTDAPVMEALPSTPTLPMGSPAPGPAPSPAPAPQKTEPEISSSGPVSSATVAVVEQAVAAAQAATLPVEAVASSEPAAGVAAVPEAVPVTVGSSMTDALKNATGSQSNDAIPVPTRETVGYSAAVDGENPPLAKPITGNTGRRRTKKRR